MQLSIGEFRRLVDQQDSGQHDRHEFGDSTHGRDSSWSAWPEQDCGYKMRGAVSRTGSNPQQLSSAASALQIQTLANIAPRGDTVRVFGNFLG